MTALKKSYGEGMTPELVLADARLHNVGATPVSANEAFFDFMDDSRQVYSAHEISAVANKARDAGLIASAQVAFDGNWNAAFLMDYTAAKIGAPVVNVPATGYQTLKAMGMEPN